SNVRPHALDDLEPCRLKRCRIKRPTIIRRIINPGHNHIGTSSRRTRRLDRNLSLRRRACRIRLRRPATIRVTNQRITRSDTNTRPRHVQRPNLHVASVNNTLSTRRSSSEHSPHNLRRMLKPTTNKVGHTLHSHTNTLLTGGRTPESPKRSHAPSPSDPSP